MSLGSVAGTLYDQRPFISLVACAGIVAIAIAHFFVSHPRNFANNARVLLIFGAIFLHLAAIKIVGSLIESQGWEASNFFLLIPFAFAPILLSVMISRNFGLFATITTSILGGFVLRLPEFLPFMVINLTSGFVAVYVTHQLRRRTRFLKVGFYCGITAVVCCLAFGFLEVPRTDVGDILWGSFAWKAALPMLVAIGGTLLMGSLIPLVESVFQTTTAVSWSELADLNHPLLRRLSIEAPGTYHHSLMVANLSEGAAEAIGANVTMCRVCSYFHDIGKLNKPGYCIENIGPGADNPHDDLTPNMSAIVIMAHVKDGVDLALKHSLNDEIIDVIEQHHGTSLILYFYTKALRQRAELDRQVEEGSASEDDLSEVDESGFRYPGPKPQARESAIISLADAIESASRSLEKPTHQRIEQLVDEIVRGRILDGQLDDCELTLGEVGVIRENFAKTLRSMLHSRVSYRQAAENESPSTSNDKEGVATAGGATVPNDGSGSPSAGEGEKKNKASKRSSKRNDAAARAKKATEIGVV